MVDEEDVVLLRRARIGDTSAFDRLVRRHERRIRAVAFRITGNQHDAEDVAQQAFVRAFERLHGFADRGSVVGWFLRIAVNAALTFVKRRSRMVGLTPEASEAVPQAARRTADSVEVALIREALAGLPEKQRAAFILRHYEELSYQEVAAALSCAEPTARAHYCFAVQALRKRLAPHLEGLTP